MYLIQNYKMPYRGWIYISGPISADPEAARDSFARVEKSLKAAGYPRVINPEARLRGLEMTHGEILRVCRELLKGCDVLLLHGDWKHSAGACMEVGMAMALGLEIVEYDGSNLRALDY